ncbi:outer membrane protein assembly factor BamB family protein [Aporhodopirellula aestuarii]|uniref:PQQ-binding-like beta-propeller repeat protein n=1 Tax=Aporhodopirellula aestuarii TaxID=2950107 RepID=A0ABT0U572_9BACT|nr:PQQ-binding-like beta-propeller repeat protein [Aporhodopirellula aestuarii]MCM2371710.1 PQQ-binding-like beta-propeller repeat protein [Aporhodopirellula aestuarii]
MTTYFAPSLFRASMLLLVGGLAFPCHAENWGHWRGPDGNAVSDSANPPTQFNHSENLRWKTPIPGRGSGSPIVWGDDVFVVSAIPVSGGEIPKHQFVLFCFNRKTGGERWRRVAVEATPHQETHSTNGFASASPVTDGNYVYASFGSRGLYCYTMTGDLVWKRTDFPPMTTRNGFGEGSSPTLVGNRLIMPWDHEGQSKLYSLDSSTGATIWEINRDEPTNWATPLVVEHLGQLEIIMNGENFARAYDFESGAELWRCAGQTQRPAASPVYRNGVVYIASGFRGSYLGAFRVAGRGDLQGTANVLWTIERDTPDIASPLLSEDRLYFYKARAGLLTCVDATSGKPHYNAQRIRGLDNIYASPVAAGGHVYLSDRDGTVVVIKDSPRLEIVATNELGETIDATPAPVDEELFIRGEKHLFCFSR